MSATLTLSSGVFLMLLTATGYAVATAGMKLASGALTPVSVGLIVAGLICAALGEIRLLRQANLSVIYFGILTVETIMVAGFAAALGDRMTLPQIIGAVLVLGGFFLVVMPE